MRALTSAGKPLGATNTTKEFTSRLLGPPDSATVGTLGSERLRLAELTTANVADLVAKGAVRKGQPVKVLGQDGKQIETGRISKILAFRGIERTDVERGQVLAAPGSITPHTRFKAEAYVLTKEEGGRHTPFFKGYRPQFYFRTTDVTGVVQLNPGVEMVMPGDNVSVTAELISPIAMDQGLRFAVREGGKTVGSGVVTEILA